MALGIPWILGHRVYRNQQGKQAPPLGGVPESTEQISLVSYTERLDSVSLKFINEYVICWQVKLTIRRVFTTSRPKQESSIEHRQNTNFKPIRVGVTSLIPEGKEIKSNSFKMY